METLFDSLKKTLPRLNQCYLCKGWYLEKNLQPVEIPDQAGYVQKRGCKRCLDEIMAGSGLQDEPQAGEKERQGVR
jgi:hypothetical protein